MKWKKTHWHKISLPIRLHYKQGSWSKHVKTQDQIADIFTKPLEYDVFAKMRDMLEVIMKSSLKRMLKVN
jgi:hypothetical protein